MTSTPLSDAELASRCRAGDHDAWCELVTRFSRYVVAIARAFGLREADVEDVFQDVFAKAYERLETLKSDESLRPWLAQLTRRTCTDRLRMAARERPTEQAAEVAEPEDRLVQIEEAFDLRSALLELPEECREILDRFFCLDQSYRTIGEALDLPSGTIASRISRCLAKLRDGFGEEVAGHVRLVLR